MNRTLGMHGIPSATGIMVWAALLVLVWPGAGEPNPVLNAWKFEVLHHKNGKTYKGLVREESNTEIKFWEVKLPLREEARRLYHVFERRLVVRIDRLDAKEREVLWDRIRAINPIVKTKDEKERLENIDRQLVPSVDGKLHGLGYTSDYFVLHSDARRSIVSRAALRLEQIFAAYGRFLPSRRPISSTKSTRILLLHSLEEYQTLTKSQGRNLFNPAFYDPIQNQIVCGSEFQRLGEALEQVRKQEEDLEKQIAYLNKRYKGKIPALLRGQLQRDRKEIKAVNKKNDEIFNEVSKRLFQTLYHEAFHAYLRNFVYSPKEAKVPYWLNEGLAQIFETALIDAGTLRVGHVDDKRLQRVRLLLKEGQLVSVSEILKAGPRQFHVTHASAQQLADRYYLTSWALAFYLLVDQKLITHSEKLNRYVSSLKREANPLAAFRRFTGQPLPQFEKTFRDYLVRLKPDGSLVKKPRQ